MDKLFGGNCGEEDLRRIADIRLRLGITAAGDAGAVAAEAKDDTEFRENVSLKA